MNYEQAMRYLEEMNRYGSVPGLAATRELCSRLGNPQESLQFVHIAGTCFGVYIYRTDAGRIPDGPIYISGGP